MHEYDQFSPYVTRCFWVCELWNGGRVAFSLRASFPFGHIVKSTRASGTRREMRPLARLSSLSQIGELAHRLSSVERAQAEKRENEKWELKAELRMKLMIGLRFRLGFVAMFFIFLLIRVLVPPLPVPVSLVWFKPREHSFVLKLVIHYYTQKQQIKTKNTIDPQKIKLRFGFITVTKQKKEMIVSVQIYLKYLQ